MKVVLRKGSDSLIDTYYYEWNISTWSKLFWKVIDGLKHHYIVDP
jgi:hypothetical protein